MEIKFKKLTPAIVEGIGLYKKALDYVFEEDDITNVALTGIYGAGKSSVWKTYEENKGNNFCIHISLASFFEEDNSNPKKIDDNGEKFNSDNKESKIEDKKRIEGHIINQLIHQIDNKNIPYTRFKIKNTSNYKGKKIKNTTILSVLTILAIIFRKDLLNFIEKSFKGININAIIIVSIIFIIIVLCYIVSNVIEYQLKNPIIKNISFFNNKIELFDSKEDSILDKNLDEIIYILQNSGVKAIVFEDLDRYNDISIFSKLREINYLVNKRLKKEDHKEVSNIKFIYLLKDNMFKSKDRTKFFDFIIPIVPSINTNNSYEIMIKAFDEYINKNETEQDDNKAKLLDKMFIRKLSYYIDDRRLLRNIYNEFIIYKNQIDVDKRRLDLNKLLAILFYKNIFPDDFADLQINRGYVYNLFKKKNDFIDKKISLIKQRIEEKQMDIKGLETAIENSESELMAIFMSGNRIYSDLKKETNRDVAKEILEKEDGSYISYYVYDYGSAGKYKRDIIQGLNENKEFVERKKRLNNQVREERIKSLKSEIEELKDEKNSLNSKSFSDIIKDIKDDIFDIENYKEIMENHYFGMIRFLIISGNLDELYFEYMGDFKEGSMKLKDKIFQMSVWENNEKGYDYELINPKEIISWFKEDDFTRVGILNFDLLDYLINEENSEYLCVFIKTMLKYGRINFLNGYLESRDREYQNKLVIFCNEEFQDMLNKVLFHQEITNDIKDLYIRITLIKSKKDFNSINVENKFKNYLENYANIFENILYTEEDKVIESLKTLDVEIKELNNLIGDLSENIIKSISKYKLYKFNFKNIIFIINKLKPEYNNEGLVTQNYSILKENEGLKDVLDYVESNMETYISEINKYASDSKNYNNIKYLNSIEDTKSLINTKVKNIELIKEFIKNNDRSIDYLDSIENQSFWELLIETDNLELNYFNILIYVNNNNVNNDKFKGYISKFKSETIKNTIGQRVVDFENREKSEKILLSCIDINDNIYDSICEVSKYIFDEFVLDNLSENKLKSLIDNNRIEFNKENFEFINENYSDNIDIFINKNYDLYIQDIKEDNFQLSEKLILFILKSKIISEKRKLKILDYYDEEIPLNEIINLSDNIVKECISSKLSRNDVQVLVDQYDNIKCKDIVIKKVVRNSDFVQFNNANKQFIIDILSNEESDEILRLRVISEVIDKYKIGDIKEFFKVGKLDNFKRALENGYPKINRNEYSEKIMKFLDDENFISSITIIDDSVWKLNSNGNKY